MSLRDDIPSSVSTSWLTSKTSKRTANALLTCIITFLTLVLVRNDILMGYEATQTFSDPSVKLPSQRHRLRAQRKASRLDRFYIPGILSESKSVSTQQFKAVQAEDHLTSKYNSTIVIGRMKADKPRVKWVYDGLLDIQDREIYIVDDAKTKLPHLAKNHGREAAVYLTYIIDHYDKLNDITFFWHTDKIVWHNNLLLKWNSVDTINKMDRMNIIRQGYVPSCDHWPGCPAWVKFNPSKAEHRLDPHRLEEMFEPELFSEIFPEAEEFPPYFAGTCCSQFAVSRDTIRARSKETYQRLLDWVLKYNWDDRSGMVLEYTWPYIFLGRGTLCPSMEECYCKTYKMCIQDPRDVEQIEDWNDMRTRREEVKWQLTFAEEARDTREKTLKKTGASKKEVDIVTETFQPEIERLNHTLTKLTDSTWQARENIIHRWKLGVPPVGW